ncbi:RNA-directed DNA polymerase from mobile element jockey [Lucilia cuprina]|nr:RNA-directed DNA polymerase from mobile element jockey [Lucilia cuprina]
MSTENLIIYKRKNALFNRAKKIAKRNSFLEFTEQFNPSSSSAHLWQGIRKLTGNYASHSINSICYNGNTITNAKELSNTFGKYWSDCSNDINFSSNFQSSKIQILSSLQISSPPNKTLILEKPFNMQELSYSFKTSKGKTPGMDKIPYSMLKNVPYIFKERILKLFNKIFEIGVIPQFFKTALVIAIYKNGKSIENIDSFRPISLLPCLTKIQWKKLF